MNKTIAIVCALCLLFSTTVFTASQAQQNMEPSGPVGAAQAKPSLPKEKNFLQDLFTFVKQKIEVGTSVLKTLGNIKALASTASESAQANPAISSAAAGVASVGLTAAHISSTGASYHYNATDTRFREKIQAANRITQIEKYSRPILDSTFLPTKHDFLQHHEVALQLDNMLWVLLSFEKEGLLTRLAFSSKELVGPNSKLLEGKKVVVSVKRLLNFLKRYDGQEYHLLLSNCRDFSQALWEAIVQ